MSGPLYTEQIKKAISSNSEDMNIYSKLQNFKWYKKRSSMAKDENGNSVEKVYSITIQWSKESLAIKIAVCELCGWNNKTAKKIAKTKWEDLSPAAKNVLIRHGIIG